MKVLVSKGAAEATLRQLRIHLKRDCVHANTAISKQLRNHYILGWLLGKLNDYEFKSSQTAQPPVFWRFSQHAYQVITELCLLNNIQVVAPVGNARLRNPNPIASFPFEPNLKVNRAQLKWLSTNGWIVEIPEDLIV